MTISNESPEDRFDQLQKNIKKLNQLSIKLERSLAIRKIWPEAFIHGKVYSYLSGNIFDKVYLVIYNSEETKTFNLKDVPWVILKSHIITMIKKSTNPYHLTFWNKLYRELNSEAGNEH